MKPMDRAIYSALTGRAALTALLATTTSIFREVAPPGSVTPYVVFIAQDSDDRYVFSGRAFEWLPYVVKGVTGPTLDSEAGDDINEQIDLALTDAALSVSGHTLMYARRQGRIHYAEKASDSDMYYHIGGRYRFGVDPT